MLISYNPKIRKSKLPMKFVCIVALPLLLFSCKSSEERSGQKAIDRYVIFVDSVNEASYKKRIERWDFIEMEHSRKINDAKDALHKINFQDRNKQYDRIIEYYNKYRGVKAQINTR